MFKKRKFGFIEVQNENISFISLGEGGAWDCLKNISLIDVIDKENSINPVSEDFKHYDFMLLIVPDFWLGSSRYPFRSHNKSVINAFISRKLTSEFPAIPKIKDFYSYDIVINDKGEQEIVARYPQEPRFYDLYRFLTQSNLRTLRISSPGLLWNNKLGQKIDDFEKIGLGFIYLSDRECSFFFYSMGLLIFSRTISLPEIQENITEHFGLITYEMNQSIYHFSQRTKKDLDKIFVFSGKEIDLDQLSELLGREAFLLPSKSNRIESSNNGGELYGIAAEFEPEDISNPLNLPGLSDRTSLTELAWNKIYLIGVLIGVILLLALGLEFIFLNRIRDRESLYVSAVDLEARQLIQEYNQALDVLLNEKGREDPLELISRVAASLSDDIQIESVDVSVEENPFISITGIIAARGAEELGNILRGFLERVNINIGSGSPVTMDDVDIEVKGYFSDRDYHEYRFSFKLDVT